MHRTASTTRQLVDVDSIKIFMSNLCTGLIIWNATERNNINSQVKDIMLHQTKIFLTGIRSLMLINTQEPTSPPPYKNIFSFLIRQAHVPKYMVHSTGANILFAEEFWRRVCPVNYFPFAHIFDVITSLVSGCIVGVGRVRTVTRAPLCVTSLVGRYYIKHNCRYHSNVWQQDGGVTIATMYR